MTGAYRVSWVCALSLAVALGYVCSSRPTAGASIFHRPAYLRITEAARRWFKEAEVVMSGRVHKQFSSDESRRIYEARYAYLVAVDKIKSRVASYRGGPPTEIEFAIGSKGAPGQPLGASLNNYAPDNLADLEVVRLFEIAELVRQGRELASERRLEPGNEPSLNIKMLDTLIRAMLSSPPAREFKAAPTLSGQREGETAGASASECMICLNCHDSKLWAELPCKHRLHANCAAKWSYVQGMPSSCPACRGEFRMPIRLPETDR